MEKSSLALAQIFDPIRADLAEVDAEFGRHIESQIDLIPKIGKYIQTSGGKPFDPAKLTVVRLKFDRTTMGVICVSSMGFGQLKEN